MKNSVIGKRSFRIFRVEKEYIKGSIFKKSCVKTNKITMRKFSAKGYDEARKELKDYKKVANKAYTYYIEEIHSYIVKSKNGKKIKTYDSFIDQMNDEINSRSILVKIWDWIYINLWYWFIDKPKTFCFWFKNLFYWIKNKHNYNESWNLDCHILNDLTWNIPILVKNKHGISQRFLDYAVKESHVNDKGFDINKWNKNNRSYTSEEESKAIEYQNAEFMKVVEYIKLYEYYRDFGAIDMSKKENVEFDKKWHHTIPIIPDTYDSIDYEKLNALTYRYWNRIWEWMRNYGCDLWD